MNTPRAATDQSIGYGKNDPDYAVIGHAGYDGFEPIFRRVTWKDDFKKTHWSALYAPTAEVIKWDGASDRTTHCTGHYARGFSYVVLEQTGRKLRRVPNTSVYAYKGMITFNAGTDNEDRCDCWLIDEQA